MKFTIFTTTLLGFASFAICAPTTAAAAAAVTQRQSTLQQITDSYVFSISIGQFIDNRNAKRGPAELDWSSDGCSDSPDNPFGFDCTPPLHVHLHLPSSNSPFPVWNPPNNPPTTVINSCYRHDFAYRNFKAQSRFTDANKARIDSNFKTDMYNQCKSESYRDACEATATVYYEAVKAFGKKRGVEVREAMAMERRETGGL
jgi:hypothetical protein